ncbi:serine/threonine protein kinase [Longispora urticae]
MSHPLLDIAAVDAVAPYLHRVGEVFRTFDQQGSGCVAYGVEVDARRWFVKTALTRSADASLRRAVAFHAMVRHPAIVPLRHAITVGETLALVYSWQRGEVLHQPGWSRRDPAGALSRFRQRPVREVERALGRLLDAHLAVERAGLVAVDLNEGALLYDFGTGTLALCDLDEYRPGPFTPTEQVSGAVRLMAPEEYPFAPDKVIDIRTTVYTLGRILRTLLDSEDDESAWRGTADQLDVVGVACQPDPERRFDSVRSLVAAWRKATL